MKLRNPHDRPDMFPIQLKLLGVLLKLLGMLLKLLGMLLELTGMLLTFVQKQLRCHGKRLQTFIDGHRFNLPAWA